jgi:hypothetical protein
MVWGSCYPLVFYTFLQLTLSKQMGGEKKMALMELKTETRIRRFNQDQS